MAKKKTSGFIPLPSYLRRWQKKEKKKRGGKRKNKEIIYRICLKKTSKKGKK